MMASGKKVDKAVDQEMDVAFEDQQRINLFARKNARLNDLKEQIQAKEKELQNLEDASDDLMLADDELYTPYQVGEVFFHLSNEDAQESLERAKTNLQGEVAALRSDAAKIGGVLSELKVQLYAKFGDNINLEADES